MAREINSLKKDHKEEEANALGSELKVLSKSLGILQQNPDDFFKAGARLNEEEIDNLIKKRNEARSNRDFKLADEIRDDLLSKGIVLEDKESGTVYPTAPGTLVGEFDESLFDFKNAQFKEILHDFNLFQEVLRKIRGGKPFTCLLTVSPVPLIATAGGKHVLVSTVYSKAILRSVAGQLSANQAHIDYFPSYEIVTNPRIHSSGFADNLRSVRDETVETVMRHFFVEHPVLKSSQKMPCSEMPRPKNQDNIQCEEALMEAFGK